MRKSMVNPVMSPNFNVQRGSLISVTTTMTTTSETVGFNWCEILRKVERQRISFVSGLLICLGALAVNYSYIIYGNLKKIENVYDGESLPIRPLCASMWYIGACFGSIVCGFSRYTWPAQMTHYVTGVILFGSCVLICLHDYVWPDANTFIYLARFFAGGVFGFGYIVIITHISDNSWKMVRGYIAAGPSFITTASLAFGVSFNRFSMETGSIVNLWIILILFILTLLGLGTVWLAKEPITRYLYADNFTEAQTNFSNLCNDLIDPIRVRTEVCEKARMISEDYDDKESRIIWFDIFKNGNVKPILGMILLRSFSFLTSSRFMITLSGAAMFESKIFLMEIIILIVRTIVLFIPLYSLDKLGRKAMFVISGIGSGIFFIPFTFSVFRFIRIREDLLAIITIMIHIFAAFGIESTQHVYATEAFPLSKRNTSLAFVTCIEYIWHAIVLVWWINKRTIFLRILLLIAPFWLIIGSIVLFCQVPETKSKTVRKCRSAFNKFYANRPRIPGIYTIGSAYMQERIPE